MTSTRPRSPDTPVVLAYHAISASWDSPLAIPPEIVEKQLEYFHRRGFVGLTFAQSERLRSTNALPDRSLVVTFDDAYASVLDVEPALRRFDFPGTVFVVTEFPDSGRGLTWFGIADDGDEEQRAALGWGELRRLSSLGWEVGSHTVSTPCLLCSTHTTSTQSLAARERRSSSKSACARPWRTPTASLTTESQKRQRAWDTRPAVP